MPLLPLLAALVGLFGLVATTGCSSTPDKGLLVREGDAKRSMPESVTAYGYHHINGQLLDPARLNSNERLSLADAQRAGLFAVQGVRYETVVKGTEKDRTVVSSIGYGGDLVNITIKARDSLKVPGGTGHWLITTINVPFVYNAGDALEQAITNNIAYIVEVPVDRASTSGPKFVALRALEAVLKHRYGAKAGKYEGTAFVLRNEPRVERMSVADRNEDRRWTTGGGASMKIAGDPEKKKLVCEVHIVLAHDFQTTVLQDAQMQPFEKVLPKK